MASPHKRPVTPDNLDRELADALRVEPSGEFRARIRTRLAGEQMTIGWGLRLPRAAYAAIAGVVIAAAIWFLPQRPAPLREAIGEIPATPVVAPPTETVSMAAVPHPATPSRERDRVLQRVLRPTPRARATEPAMPQASESTTAPERTPEVLLSDSERAGVQLLLESAASGRLRLPEEMLRDLSLPIVEARTVLPDPDSPWVTVEGAVQ